MSGEDKKDNKNKGSEKTVNKEEFLKILESLPEEQQAEILKTMKFSLDGNESRLYKGGVLTEGSDGEKQFVRSTEETELVYTQKPDGSQAVIQKDNRSGDARMMMVSENEFMEIDKDGVRFYDAEDDSSMKLTKEGIVLHDETSSAFLGKKQSTFVYDDGHIVTLKYGKRKSQLTTDDVEDSSAVQKGKITYKAEKYATGKLKSVERKVEGLNFRSEDKSHISGEGTLSAKIDFEKDGETVKSVKISGSEWSENLDDLDMMQAGAKDKLNLDVSLKDDVLKIERRCFTQFPYHSVLQSEMKLTYDFSTGEGKKQCDTYEYDDHGKARKKSSYEEFYREGDVDLTKKNIALYALDDDFYDEVDFVEDEYGFDAFFEEMVPDKNSEEYRKAMRDLDSSRNWSDYLLSKLPAVEESPKEERQPDLTDEDRATLKENLKEQEGENNGANKATVERFANKCSQRKAEEKRTSQQKKAQPNKKQPVNLGVLTRYKEVQGIR